LITMVLNPLLRRIASTVPTSPHIPTSPLSGRIHKYGDNYRRACAGNGHRSHTGARRARGHRA
jgi:hypothetical protein